MTIERSAKAFYAAPASEKGLDILELLTGSEVGLSQQQIAARLRRSSSEIFRMLNCLRDRGYIHRSYPDDLYHLAPKLFVPAHQHPPIHRLHETAMPILRELSRTVCQSCHLAIVDEEKVLVVAQVDALGPMGFSVRVGTRAGLHLTGSGIVLLAFEDGDRRERLFDSIAYKLTEDTRLELIHCLKTVHRRGYEQRPIQFIGGLVDVSAPVFNHAGRTIAAMTVPYLRRANANSPIEKARESVVEAARRLSIKLGSLIIAARCHRIEATEASSICGWSRPRSG